MNSKKMQSNLMLLLTAFIWGVAFVAQSVGMDYVGPFTFNSVRNFIGAFVLLLFIPTDNPQQPSTLPTVMRPLPPTLHRHPPHLYLTRKH